MVRARDLKPHIKPVDGLTIEPLKNYDQFEHYDHPFWGRMSTPRRRGALAADKRMTEVEPHVWHFVASLDGEPLGCSVLSLGGGVAGIYDVGVVPKARRQGIGTAITLAPCVFAQELGYQAAVLVPSPEGKLIYDRMGFEEVCKMSCYDYSKAQQERQRNQTPSV